MDNNNAPKLKTGRMVAKNLIVLLTVLICGLVGMWAWFTQTTSATADGVNVECQAPDGLEIAIVAAGESAPETSSYKTGSITLNSDNFDFVKTLSLSAITSDGITFTDPNLVQSNGTAYVDTSTASSWRSATANTDYLSFDLYMRMKSEHTVTLTQDTNISPVTEVTSGEITTENDDAVVGAVRFSVLSSGTSQNRLLFWIPAPNIYYNDGDLLTGLTTDTYGTYTHTYDYVSGDTASTGTINSTISGFVANTDCDYTLGKTVDIVTLNSESDGYYYGHVTCNMWVEGEDAEARLALVDGEFKATLKLGIKTD